MSEVHQRTKLRAFAQKCFGTQARLRANDPNVVTYEFLLDGLTGAAKNLSSTTNHKGFIVIFLQIIYNHFTVVKSLKSGMSILIYHLNPIC